jgi:hypothetical protein
MMDGLLMAWLVPAHDGCRTTISESHGMLTKVQVAIGIAVLVTIDATC